MTNMTKLGVRRRPWLMVLVLALGTACDSETTGPAPAPAPVDRVQVSPAASVLEVGATRRYSARAFAADGAELFGRPVAWSASSDAVTVSETGLVTAVKPGYADVTATVDGVSAAVGLTVPTPEPQPEPVASVLVTPGAALVEVGTATQYSARAFARDGSELFGRPVEWSAHGDAVSVSPGGVVTAVRAGYADVIATVEGVVAAVGVTVIPLEAPPDPVAYVIVAPGETAVFEGLWVWALP